MVDSARSLLDRLKNKSRRIGKDFQLILQLFCQEEFLRRLQYSQYNKNFILKGGLFLYSISGFESRPTRDMDFLIKNISNAQESLLLILKDIISIETSYSFVVFVIKGLEPIAELRKYSGIRAKVISRIKNTRTPFDIDIGVGDIIIPKTELHTMPTQLDSFEKPEIYVYSLESTISEKLDAIISRLELGSRMKDYYDIYYLANTYSFDARKLQQAIFETLQNRGTPYEADTLKYVQAFTEDKTMLFKWNQYKKDTLKMDIEFGEIIDTIMKFISPVFNAIVKEDEFFGKWDPEKCTYKSL